MLTIMKNHFLFIFFLLFCLTGFGQSLPIDFEGDILTGDFNDFNGGTATVLANPSVSGINTSPTVARIIRNGGAVFAGSKIILTENLDFSVETVLSMKVYTTAPIGTTVKFKLEGGTNREIDVETTITGAWETLEWDFAPVAAAASTNNQIVFMFDFGNVGDGSANSTFYFDDIEQINPNATSLPIDFEGDVTTGDFANFDGGVGSVVANPSSSGINTSASVGRIVRAAQDFSGSRIILGQNLDFSIESFIYMKVYTTAPIGTPIIFKLEGATPTAEDNVVTTVSGEWEIFEFDFTGTLTTLNELVFLFDAGNPGNGSASSTFYFDDIVQSTQIINPGTAPIPLPINFEGGSVSDDNFGAIDGGFGGANGIFSGAATVIANPHIGGINTSLTVGQIVRHPGSDQAGASVDLPVNLNFDAYPIICMNVYTEAPAGTEVTLRIEDTDTGQPDIDAVALTTVSGEWEPLCFVYQLAPDAYDRITFLFDLGNIGDGSSTSTFLFDDVEQLITPPDFFYTLGSAYFCPGFPVTFTFPGTGDYEWYSDQTLTNLVGTGNPFTSPPLFNNTSYYVRDISSVAIPQTDVGPTELGPADDLVSPQTATLDFTSNISSGLWHSVNVVGQIISAIGQCTYTVTGHNLTLGTSQTRVRTLSMPTPDGVNLKYLYTFPSPVPMGIGDNMQLQVSVSGNSGCRLRSFEIGPALPTIPSYPSTTVGGELTFTGYDLVGTPAVQNQRWMGFDYRISGDLPADPTIYQVNAIADCANPLPIELLDFSVRERDGDALLYWSTAYELNNDRFELLRSRDGFDYQKIGIVNGAGNSSTILNYTFLDHEPLKGVSYYKLKQVDFDGQESSSDPVPFLNESTQGFRLFPNPTTSDLTLTFSEDYERIEVLVYGISGSMVNHHTFSALENVNFKLNGNPGMYFVEVRANGERKATFHVMKY